MVQDTSSDLQLFAILSVTLVVTGGLLKGSVIKFFDALLPLNDVSSSDAWWRNFYQVCRPTLFVCRPRCFWHMSGRAAGPAPLNLQPATGSSLDGTHSCIVIDSVVQVGLLLFGENFPPATDPPAEQVFSLVTASVGLASFALILALVEQVPTPTVEGLT
jgi:hypothetical protein